MTNVSHKVVEVTPPIYNINPISPYWQLSAPFTVTAQATDELSGVAQVELRYRHSYDNLFDTPKELKWENFGWGVENLERPSQWYWDNFDAPRGDGYYEFYSIAVGSREEAPAEADARAGVDRVVPSSRVNPIDPYWQLTTPFTVTARASEESERGCQGRALVSL